jgi:hypothetical protein
MDGKTQITRICECCHKEFIAQIYEPLFFALTDYKNYLKKLLNPPIKLEQNNRIDSEIQDALFCSLNFDFRNEKKGVFSYKQMIKNSSRFAQLEEELFNNGYIAKNYQFSDNHGQKQYLAAYYHQLIRKGYFNNRIFPENISNTNLYIRKFLDHRYNTNVDKQFRNWDNNQNALVDFIEKDYWLDHILLC